MRFFGNQHRDERLIWSRDTRYLHRLRERVPEGRLIELSTGAILIAPSDILTESLATEIAGPSGGPDFDKMNPAQRRAYDQHRLARKFG